MVSNESSNRLRVSALRGTLSVVAATAVSGPYQTGAFAQSRRHAAGLPVLSPRQLCTKRLAAQRPNPPHIARRATTPGPCFSGRTQGGSGPRGRSVSRTVRFTALPLTRLIHWPRDGRTAHAQPPPLVLKVARALERQDLDFWLCACMDVAPPVGRRPTRDW